LVDLDEAAAAYHRWVSTVPGSARDRTAMRAEFIELGLPLAGALARRYRGRGEPIEDLVQVARYGLVKAVDGYDPELGTFTAYASATIRGELKRHFRDHTWGVRVPRRLQELSQGVNHARARLAGELHRQPTPQELAKELGVEVGQVDAATMSASAYRPRSLHATNDDPDGAALVDAIGEADPALDMVEDWVTVEGLLCRLPTRERQILAMRFYGNKTQSEMAAELGLSQMHVSRLLTKALGWLRQAMLSDSPSSWEPAAVYPAPSAGESGIVVDPVQGDVWVRLAGEFDADQADGLRDALTEAARERPARIRVDMARVSLLDAAAMAALVTGYRAAQIARARFDVVRPQRFVRRAMIAAGLTYLLGDDRRG